MPDVTVTLTDTAGVPMANADFDVFGEPVEILAFGQVQTRNVLVAHGIGLVTTRMVSATTDRHGSATVLLLPTSAFLRGADGSVPLYRLDLPGNTAESPRYVRFALSDDDQNVATAVENSLNVLLSLGAPDEQCDLFRKVAA